MKTIELDYQLPDGLIAQHPASPRDNSRLLVLARNPFSIKHHRFSEITKYLKAGDVLVLNDTKVRPCRIIMHKVHGEARPGGRSPDEHRGGKAEVLLTREHDDRTWSALINSNGRLKPGTFLHYDPGLTTKTQRTQNHPLPSVGEGRVRGTKIKAELLTRQDGLWQLRFTPLLTEQLMNRIGIAPLPPYIKRDGAAGRTQDIKDYQTVYADKSGAIAAPTAGLHFTKQLIAKLQRNGVRIAHVTLHTGLGTFRPIKADKLSQHKMDAEEFEVNPITIQELSQARRDGRRIIAVGTTVTRVLETISGYVSSLLVHPWLLAKHIPRTSVVTGLTDIFIYPPYKFKLVDALITNFHLPHGTPLALVSAFAGRSKVMTAYQQAIKKKYRFYSYGDAMLIT